MSRWMRFAVKRKRLFFYPAVITGILFLSLLRAQAALARTYTITDGPRVMTYTTFATDPDQVLGEAGLVLEGEDSYQAGGRDISISRSARVKLRYYGRDLFLSAEGRTVGGLLEEAGITLQPGDRISHGLQETALPGMEVVIDHILLREETYTAALAHDTTYCYAPELPQGVQEVLIRGRDGQLRRTVQVTYTNARETSRELLEEIMTAAPITEVVAIGTGVPPETPKPGAMPVIEDGCIRLPTGEVLTYYKTDTVRATAYTHTDAGCDYITYTGTRVRVGTVAVDPRFIPYGTRMFIVSNDGEYIYGLAVAEDCGGAIKRDRIDLYFPTYQECMAFGRRSCTIYFLN